MTTEGTVPARALTRRELRELERRNAPFAEEQPAVAQDSIADIAAETTVLTAEAQILVAAELAEPSLETVVIRQQDLSLPEEPAYEQIPSDISPNTITTSIPLPSRAALRAQLRAEQAFTEAPAPLATAEAAAPRTASVAPERVLPDFVPRTRAKTAPASRAPVSVHSGHHRMRMLATKTGSIVAMSVVAMLAVATSLPADSLLSSSDVRAAALEATMPVSTEPAQTIDLAGTDTITVQQDSYQARSIAEVAAASGIRLEDTFTNNPNGTVQWPFAVGVHVGDQFGPRNCAGCSANHGGQDFNPGVGAPIQAIADGVVSYTEDGEASLGVHMIIDHMIDGELVSSVYAHMIHGSMLLETGDVVKVGQVIGKVGSTGMSTGPHLHFEIRVGGIKGTKVAPLPWLYANTN
ncbi:peptidoglycan DD-metalloendopeptidase family protein [Cryobacterium sp. 1639]|uniref:M23 family metallopeptidase n=1 Tax=Cryobacterium inferilacus TaxID=2866629 RepID=UPI001C7353EA|nr:M23 family metallopeptidase [Cryobacterium sp. 1639]MBX0300738.1 peptidoglycan DD-metalloendopeptidase family protein [Cryobacterium sp. 1639]